MLSKVNSTNWLLGTNNIIKYVNEIKQSDQNYSFESTKKNIKVVDCNRIDITKVKHNKVSRECCKLHHESCIPDYLDHFVQEYSSYFENCDILLISNKGGLFKYYFSSNGLL